MKKFKSHHMFVNAVSTERFCLEEKLNARPRSKMVYSRDQKKWVLVREELSGQDLHRIEVSHFSRVI